MMVETGQHPQLPAPLVSPKALWMWALGRGDPI